ncbi:hypothetical protein Plhal703r1_c15g0074891 [Plasmopara halstedii]
MRFAWIRKPSLLISQRRSCNDICLHVKLSFCPVNLNFVSKLEQVMIIFLSLMSLFT